MKQVDGMWAGTVPFLLLGPELAFRAVAYDDSQQALLRGEVRRSFQGSDERMTISLAPVAPDDNDLLIPRITRISVPGEVASGGSSSVTFSISAAAGQTIRFQLTPATGGGEFFPQSGQITLVGTEGSDSRPMAGGQQRCRCCHEAWSYPSAPRLSMPLDSNCSAGRRSRCSPATTAG